MSGPERQSVSPPSADDRTTEQRLIPSVNSGSMAAESTRDVAQEDFLFHLYRGSELLQENRVLEAKEELEFALTMQPSDPKGQDLLGAVYFRLGLYPRAIQIYEIARARLPERRVDQGQPRALLPEDRAARAGAPRAPGRDAHQPRAQASLGLPRAGAAEAR